VDDNLARAILYAICRQTAVQAVALDTQYKPSPDEIDAMALRWYKEALRVGERQTMWQL
jgi:hypothetical protein